MNFERYKLGIKEIDDQHEGFFEIINSLRDGIATRDTNADINTFLQQLIGFVKSHFTYEEKLMIDNEFSEFAAHQREHREFIMQIATYNVRNSNGTPPGGFELLSTLQQFLVEHISKTDKEFAEYIHTINSVEA